MKINPHFVEEFRDLWNFKDSGKKWCVEKDYKAGRGIYVLQTPGKAQRRSKSIRGILGSFGTEHPLKRIGPVVMA